MITSMVDMRERRWPHSPHYQLYHISSLKQLRQGGIFTLQPKKLKPGDTKQISSSLTTNIRQFGSIYLCSPQTQSFPDILFQTESPGCRRPMLYSIQNTNCFKL